MSSDRDGTTEDAGSESDDAPARDATGETDGDGPDSLPEALAVRENARTGLTTGLAVAGLLYLWLLDGVGWRLTDTALYYLSLAFVAAASLAFVVTVALCAKTGLEPVLDRANWLRRGGTAAVVGGLAWVALPAVAWLADAGAVTSVTRRRVTILAALVLLVGAAGLHAAVRDAVGRPGRVAYAVVLGGLLVAAGNASGNPDPIVETAVGPIATPFLLGAFVAVLGTVPLAAVADLTGRLPPYGTRGLLGGAALATAAVGWLVVAGGWETLVGAVAVPQAVALAAVAVPVGAGWVLAGLALRAYAVALADEREAGESEPAPNPAG